MGGKKIDRKKQTLLSRAAKRKATIKNLSHKPVIKKVDIEAIKESFKKLPKPQPQASAPAEAIESTSVIVESGAPKTHRKPKKEAE
jgi:hypothetical protein